MSRIPNLNFKSRLRAPSGFKQTGGSGRANENEKKVETVPDRVSAENGPQPSTLRLESRESDDIQADDFEDNLEPKNNDNLEKTSKNLSRLADRLNSGSSAQSELSSKPGQKPAFRRRNSSNVAKVTAGQSKDHSSAMPIHGQSPYRKSSQLSTKPPSGLQKGATGLKMPTETRIRRTSGAPASKLPGNYQNASRAQENNDDHRSSNVLAEMPQKKHRVDNFSDVAQSDSLNSTANDVTKQTKENTKKSSIASGLGRFGLKFPSMSSKVSKATNLKVTSEKSEAGSGNVMKRGTNLNVNDQIKSERFIDKQKDNKTEVSKRGSKENLTSDQHGQNAVQRRQSGNLMGQQKAASKELQAMATKLRTYTGNRPARPLSYCAGAKLTESAGQNSGAVKPRSGIPSNIKNVSSVSMQNLAKKDSHENKGGPKANKSAMSKSKSSNSLVINETIHGKNLDVTNNNKHQQLDSTWSRKQTEVSSSGNFRVLRKPSSGLVFPRSRSSSKTTNSASSEFGTSSVQLGAPYQSTPLRVVSNDDDDDDIDSKRPFVGGDYDNISGVFDDDSPVNPYQTFDRIPLTTSEPTKEIADEELHDKEVDIKSRALCNHTFNFATTERDGCTDEKQEDLNTDNVNSVRSYMEVTFDKGAASYQYPAKCKERDDLNSTHVISNKDANVDDGKIFDNSSVEIQAEPMRTSKPIECNGNRTMSLEKRPLLKSSVETDLENLDTSIDNDNLKAYCSAEFLENETMPRLDASCTMNLTGDDPSLVGTAERQKLMEKSQGNERNRTASDNVNNENSSEGKCRIDSTDKSISKSASRSLKFEGLSNSVGDEDEVLGTSLVNDSYDVVTSEEVLEATVNRRATEACESDGLTQCVDGMMHEDKQQDHSDSFTKQLRGIDIVESLETDIGKSNIVADESADDAERLNPGKQDDQGKTVNTSVDKSGNLDTGGTGLDPDSQGSEKENKSTNLNLESHGQNASSKKTNDSPSKTTFLSLLSKNLEAFDSNIEVSQDNCSVASMNEITISQPNNGAKESMKIAMRRRSLVRRNTSPYDTSSLPLSLSPAPNFRMPKETSITETEDGNVLMDESTYRQCKNDVKMMKTNILRLKRCLQQTDIMSPFHKNPYKMANSPPVTPTRPCLISRSFSDASSWLLKTNRGQDPILSDTSQNSNRTKTISSNKTDQEKVEDELSEMRKKVNGLEMEVEELKHELESKTYTIKLLQTQLERQAVAEKIEMLTEENIILMEDNQALREQLEQQENQRNRSASLKDQFMKQAGSSGTKIRSDILHRIYDQEDD